MSKNEFTVKIDNKDVVLKTIPVTPAIRNESNAEYTRVWNDSIKSGLQLRLEVERMLESKGLLDSSSDEVKLKELRKQLKDLEIELRKGLKNGVKMTKREGRALALEMRRVRAKLGEVGGNLSHYFSNTVETLSENERFQYFIYACTVYPDTGNRYWANFTAFKQETSVQLIEEATRNFLVVTAGFDKDYEKQFYENKWLRRMAFVNDKLQLINDSGQLVDEEFRLINEDGQLINDKGDLLDQYGNPVDKNGNLLVPDAWEEAEKV